VGGRVFLIADRACLTGIVFVLRGGIPWRMLLQALGCGSGMTCWQRLRDGNWQACGIERRCKEVQGDKGIRGEVTPDRV
jgi:transposase